MISPLSLEVFVICLGIFLLLFETFAQRISRTSIASLGILGLLVVLAASFRVGEPPMQLASLGFYTLDSTGLFFKQFVIVATILTLLLAIDYAPVFLRYASHPRMGLGEFFLLPIFVCAGLMFMATANEFIMIFVSLELATVALYVLVASMRRNKASLEAGTKYLILGALSTGFLVYGIAWIFGVTGQTSLDNVSLALASLPSGMIPALSLGLGLVLIALGFKIGAVPFQFWIPDTYQGAPTPITALLSVASKAAGFIVLMRVLVAFTMPDSPIIDNVLLVLALLTIATLLYANLAAMPQGNFKRLMAYSSIGHAGYLLMALVAFFDGNPEALNAIKFYFVAYLLMTFSVFAVIGIVERTVGSTEIAAYNGLGKRSPFLAIMLLVALASLAGVPFTIGFLAKFFVFAAALTSGLYLLVAVGVIAVACGFYYYFKVIRAMYWESAEDSTPLPVPLVSQIVIFLLTMGIMLFGLFPQPLLWVLAGN